MTISRLALRVWLLLAVLFGMARSGAAAELVQVDSVAVGIQGLTKVGEWAALRFQVSGPAGQALTSRVTAADIEGRPVQIAGPHLTLTAEPLTVEVIYQQGPMNSPVIVELLNAGEVIAQKTVHANDPLITLTPETDLVVCLGESVTGFENAASRAAEIRRQAPSRVAPMEVRTFTADQLSDLPANARGWQAIDICVLDAETVLPESVAQPLRQWVAAGGRLIISGGAQIPALKSGPLTLWSPIQATTATTLRDISPLGSVIQGSSNLRLRTGSRAAVRLVASHGVELVTTQEGPLVVRSAYGSGTVTALALDLNDRPFVNRVDDRNQLEWDALPELCRWLGGLPPIVEANNQDTRPQSDLNSTGVTDLQTQLVNSLDTFAEVQRPNYWVVLGQCVLFLMLVGAGDFYLVHKVLKKPHWTWITLPLWIAVGGYYGMASAWAATGQQSLIRQVDLITVDGGLQSGRVDSWLTLYEPDHRRRDVRFGNHSMRPTGTSTLRWEGRPEAGFRGLYRESGLSSGEAITSIVADSRGITSLPIRHGSTAVIAATHDSFGPLHMEAQLTDSGVGRLSGKMKYTGPGHLEEWGVAYGNLIYLPMSEAVAGAESAPAEMDFDRAPTRLLNDYLTGKQSRQIASRDKRGPEYLMVRAAYDPLGTDLYTIFRTVSFYEITGGENYTTLKNTMLRSGDLSPVIRAGRAVVFGRWRAGPSESQAGHFLIDGKPATPQNHESFIRVVLPVTPEDRSSTRPAPADPRP